MAGIMKSVLVLLVVFVCGGLSLRVEVTPNHINAITPGPVSVSCVVNPSLDREIQGIIVFKIKRQGGKTIAVFNPKSDTPVNSLNDNDVQVRGHIDQIPSKSYLHLTLLKPKKEDAGLYQCEMMCLDVEGKTKELKAASKLSFDNLDNKTVVKYLEDKVSKLESKLKDQTKVFNERETTLTNRVSVLKDKLQKQALHNSQAVIFTGRYTSRGLFEGVGDVVRFDEVDLNLGKGYEKGLFTAPKSGIYGFYLTFVTDGPYQFMELNLQVNDQTIVTTSAASSTRYPNESSNSIFVQLKANDVVKVVFGERKSGSSLAFSFNIFSGYLFKEISDNNAA